MRQFITQLAAALLLVASPSFAQSPPQLQEDAPDRYIVEPGDTLWGIAGRFLKEPWRWQDLWKLNQDQIRNPNRIYPGNVIVLDRSRGPAQLTLLPTVKLSPTVRSEPAESDAIPSIPPGKIEPFLTRPLVIEADGLNKAPRIVSTQESRVHLGPGGIAYVSGIGESKNPSWQIYRPGRALVDPDSKRTLGYEAIYLGTGRLLKAGEPATVEIVTSAQEISTGDRLIATSAPTVNQYQPRPPRNDISGKIVALYGALTTAEGGKDSIVAINRGSREGVEMGHVLALMRAGPSVPDPASTLSRDRAPLIKLPDERYGIVFVFRVFDSVSYALVMESSRPVSSGDIVRTP